jgi:hypothetical protein
VRRSSFRRLKTRILRDSEAMEDYFSQPHLLIYHANSHTINNRQGRQSRWRFRRGITAAKGALLGALSDSTREARCETGRPQCRGLLRGAPISCHRSQPRPILVHSRLSVRQTWSQSSCLTPAPGAFIANKVTLLMAVGLVAALPRLGCLN